MILSALFALASPMIAQSELPPVGPVPDANQLAWHDAEFYGFVHFGPNTFTGVEWGEGREDPNVFQPSEFDPQQWVSAFKSAGMTGVIITAKHHDGFCLWPSEYTDHDVAASSWRDGKGDVLADLSAACEEAGLWLGVYLSPWDKHEASYGSGDEYNKHFVAQLDEALSRYGTIREVWFDGACGEGPNGKKQVYEWPLFIDAVRRNQPGAVIFSDAGPDVRWCGNERAIGNTTNWATLNRAEITVGTSKMDELNLGHQGGTHWVPYECNTSIRPGWFWKAGLDGGVKPIEQLLDTWYASVGRGGNFLLNVPPDSRGLLTDVDVERLSEMGAILDATHATDLLRDAVLGANALYSASNVRAGEKSMGPASLIDPARTRYWAVDDGHDAEADAGGDALAWVEFSFEEPLTFDEIWLEEPIQLGQRVEAFRVLTEVPDTGWQEVTSGTTIGAQRILRTAETTTSRLRIAVDAALATPALSRISLYRSPAKVAIEPRDSYSLNAVPVQLRTRPGVVVRYTLDGSPVTALSPRYDGDLTIKASCELRTRAFEHGVASPFRASTNYRIVLDSEWKPGVQFIKPPDAGLRVDVFEGGWQTLDQMADRKPAATRKVTGLDLSAVTRAEQCALRFHGFISVPKDGLYTFTLSSDDGSRLRLHDELVIDHDGLHGMEPKSGKIALRQGFHPIEVSWFNARGASGLELQWSGPGIGRAVPVPDSAWFQ